MFTKNIFLIQLATIGLLHSTIAQTITRLDQSKISASALDSKIKYLLKAANVHGLAIAIFNKNEVVYKKLSAIKTLLPKNLYRQIQIFMELH